MLPVDLSVFDLGVDPRKANQMVRGTVALPHGTGKDVKRFGSCVLQTKRRRQKQQVLTTYGLDEYIEKIKGWMDRY